MTTKGTALTLAGVGVGLGGIVYLLTKKVGTVTTPAGAQVPCGCWIFDSSCIAACSAGQPAPGASGFPGAGGSSSGSG